MSLKETWVNKTDGIDDILSEDINSIANQAIANADAIDRIQTPYIGSNGNWYIYDINSKSYVDSGMPSRGQQGANGEKGDKGDKGDTPVKGVDYFTEEEKDELLSNPREVIYLTNGKRIESREDGIYMVGIDEDGENFETVLCDANGWIPEALYANEAYFAVDADFAGYANEATSDENGNVIHETYATKEEVGDISAVLEELHAYAQNLISGGETI